LANRGTSSRIQSSADDPGIAAGRSLILRRFRSRGKAEPARLKRTR
jgi:hypothetical protein